MLPRTFQPTGTYRAALWLALLWVILFLLVPLGIVAKISLSTPHYGIPPFTPLLNREDWTITLYLDAYVRLFSDPLYRAAFWGALKLATRVAVLTALVAYPLAYAITRLSARQQQTALLWLVLPFATSFLLRVYAWMNLLSMNGLLNKGLLALGLIDAPLELLYTRTAVSVGMVYCYLPFMVFPLIGSLNNIDPALLESAQDLGCRPLNAFWRVTFPLSLPGLMVGGLLVFIPAMGEYIIPELMGGHGDALISRVLWTEFFFNHDWPTAGAIACVLLAILSLPIALLYRLQGRTGL